MINPGLGPDLGRSPRFNRSCRKGTALPHIGRPSRGAVARPLGRAYRVRPQVMETFGNALPNGRATAPEETVNLNALSNHFVLADCLAASVRGL
jgi:hypothetical protein